MKKFILKSVLFLLIALSITYASQYVSNEYVLTQLCHKGQDTELRFQSPCWGPDIAWGFPIPYGQVGYVSGFYHVNWNKFSIDVFFYFFLLYSVHSAINEIKDLKKK